MQLCAFGRTIHSLVLARSLSQTAQVPNRTKHHDASTSLARFCGVFLTDASDIRKKAAVLVLLDSCLLACLLVASFAFKQSRMKTGGPIFLHNIINYVASLGHGDWSWSWRMIRADASFLIQTFSCHCPSQMSS